jgi:hypothetical protein
MNISTTNVSMDVPTKQIKHEYVLSTKNERMYLSKKT